MPARQKQNGTLLKWGTIAAVSFGFVFLVVYATIHGDALRADKLEPPFVSAPEKAVKTRPKNPGGMDIPNQDKVVFDLLKEGGTARAQRPKPVEIPKPEVKKTVAPQEAQPKPKVQKTATKPAAKPAEKPTVPAALVKGWGVQLASFLTMEDAENAQNIFLQKYGEILGRLQPYIQKTSIPNKGVRYRVRFMGAANKQTAQNACNRLKRLNQGCFPVRN